MRTKAAHPSVLLVGRLNFGEKFSVGIGSNVSIGLPDGIVAMLPPSVRDAISTAVAQWMISQGIYSSDTEKKPSKNYSRSSGKRSSTRGRTSKK